MGVQYFPNLTTLDLRWVFHQIELDSSSRDITAFVTDDGIFRDKRYKSSALILLLRSISILSLNQWQV